MGSENGSVPKTEVEVLPFKEETSTASVPPPVPKIDYLPTEYDAPTISTRNTTSSAPVHFDSASGGATLKRPSKEKKSHRPPPPEDPPPKKKKEKKEKGRGHSSGHSGQGRSSHSGQGHGKG